MQKQEHIKELYDRIRKTACSRFYAHNRLQLHNYASLWTITFFSMGLIFIPLVETFGLKSSFSPNYTNFIQVVLAILILIFSVLLSLANFAVRADRIHLCGMTLNALAFRVHKSIHEGATSEEYAALAKEYDDVLQKYENHSSLDYLYTKNHMSNYYKNPWYFPYYIRLMFAIQFIPYVLLLVGESTWIYIMVT
ncbi:SLATT domain-containing protein [Vibrio parahaemolyticus]|nr:SLATT domain-containing protein [Vibrio parahaemolyticus]EHR7166457.1 SLATT domain-containing protein [Vibrio parahaemolyticus]